MKHNLLKSVIISVILLMGVSNAWAGRVYFKPQSAWASSDARLAAYFYGSGDSWKDLKKVGDYYVCDIPEGGYTHIIFCRMNGSQSANNWGNKWNQSAGDSRITLKNNALYTQPALSNGWDGWTCTGQVITWYVAGDFNQWNTSANKLDCSINLDANKTYAFKIYGNGIWLGNDGTMTRQYSEGWIMDNAADCHITTDFAGSYQFSFDINTGKLTVAYPEQCFLKGSFNDWEETHSILNGSVTVTLAAGTHTFKIYRYDSHGTPYWCGNSGTMSRGNSFEWVMQSDISDNCTLTADRDGDYTFEYNRSTGQLTVKYPGEDYYLTGDFNSWASNTSSSFISNNSITVPLTKGIHEFKIHRIAPLIDAHYGNNGTMTRVECTGWTMETEKDNCKIEADITGDYIFTFDKSTKKVTVEYPEYGEKKTIYLNINEQPTWVDDYAKMAVRYDGTNYDMTPIGCDAKGHYLYSCDNVPIEKNIRFVRINPNNTSQIWNESSEYAVPAGNNLNCFKMTAWGTGNWGTFEEIYPVTLDPHANFKNIDFGSYSVRYNGTTYTSKPTETVTFYAPVGAQIEILEGDPINDAYYARVRAQAGAYNSIYGDNIAGYAGQTITVCGQTGFDNEFLTRASHVVYLGVPNTGDTFKKWRDTGYRYFIWLKDCPNGGLKENTGNSFTIGSTTYYKFEIPAGNRNFEFQRKVNNDGGATYVHTIEFPYEIPTTNVNCFTLTSENDGYWDILPTQEGDYRLLYVEQVVEKDADGYTVITRKKAHPSDIIRKRTESGVDTVSLHTYKERTYTANAGGGLTYTSSNNPEIILQKYLGNDQWQDVECQMVYGPIETIPAMGQLPGRKNASPGSDIDDLKYHNGIENIKNDTHVDQGNGVWNFVVTQDNAGKASVQWDQTHRYEGKYYIRTDVANGGWNNYTAFDNYMTFSSYSKNHRDFSHYFCRWILQGTNVKFTIANDYGCAISDTLDGDSFVPKDGADKGTLSENANVRFSWNQVTNNIYRAYIRGAYDPSTHERLENIVATYKKVSGGTDDKVTLDDSGNWIYQKDITDVKVGSRLESLVAEYQNVVQTFEDDIPMLTGGASEQTYTVRILYDFKIDKTLITLVPNDKEADVSIDVLIERVDQGEAKQVQAAIQAARTTEGSTVYAVMSFTRGHIESTKTEWERLYYWVSFPFDVRISEVFGFGEYGEHWIMEYYDGEERAKNGCWIDSPTYWRYITDTTGTEWTNGVLKANKGYVLALTRDIADLNIFQHTEQVSLYFPSTELITDIDADVIETQIKLDPFTCTIERNNRKIYDSNWHVIGIPSYANKNQTLKQNDLFYFYTYETSNNTYSVTTADPRDNEETEGSNVTFKSMHSYMVQFAGTINWRNEWQLNAQQLAAKKTDSEYQTHSLRLELQQNGMQTDKTFIKLQDKDGITDEFDLNIDLTKIINSGANIYTLAGKELIQLAGNVLPVGEAIIPLGIQLDAAGEYTFAMPEGTDGITVELIDYETNTRTNMLLDEYTVNLGKGTFETRFALHVKPDKTATGVENITTPSHSDVRKFIIDGVLYMQKDGILYDAQGHTVR